MTNKRDAREKFSRMRKIILSKKRSPRINKRDIVKVKFLIQQAYIWYGLIFQGPIMVYLFYKTTTVKWLAILCLIFGAVSLLVVSYVWYKYFMPDELQFNYTMNPEWKDLRSDVLRGKDND